MRSPRATLPAGFRATLRIVAIGVVMAVVTYLDVVTGPELQWSFFYFLPVVMACAWFGWWGTWAVPTTLLLSHWAQLIEAPPGAVHYPGNDLVMLLSLALVAGLTLLSRWRYGQATAAVRESVRLQQGLVTTNEELNHRQQVLDRQLSLAREVQQSILSACPAYIRVGPVEIVSAYLSAWEVGGDFLRVLPDDDGVALFIGDVMGKGVPAALLMTMMTAWLSTGPAEDPSAALQAANRAFLSNIAPLEFPGFVTAFLAYVEKGTQRLIFANAGHPPALLAHADGCVELLAGTDLPLGIQEEADYPTQSRILCPGDRLVLYTDGITEARSPDREQFGSERLVKLVRAHRADSAAGLRDALIAGVQSFIGGGILTDDLALIVAAV